jgi:hypothetical protein
VTTLVSPPASTLTPQKLTIAHPAITGLATGHPKLTFTVQRGANAPGFWGLYIELPRGLHFGHCCTPSGLRWLARHTQITSPGARHISFAYNRFNSARSWEELLFDSEFALWKAHVTISSTSLLVDPNLVRSVKAGRTKYVTVVISGDAVLPNSNTRRVRVRIS